MWDSSTQVEIQKKPYLMEFFYTRVGRDHLVNPDYWNSGCQDAFGMRDCLHGQVLVVSDGSSSAFESKTGSSAAVRLVLNISQELLALDPLPSPEEFATRLQVELLKRLRAALAPFGGIDGDITPIVEQAYYFTLMIGVVTADWTAIFNCGDGYYALNGKVEKIDSREGNYPDYIGYLLCTPIPRGFETVKIVVKEIIPTDKLRSIFLATDGIAPVINKKPKRNFSVAEIWEDRTSTQFSIARKMSEFAEDGVELSVIKTGKRVEIEPRTTKGIFGDDVTFVALVVDQLADFPVAWEEYRRRNSLSLITKAFKAPANVVTPTRNTLPPTSETVTIGGSKSQHVGDVILPGQRTTSPVKRKSIWTSLGEFIDRILFGKY